MAKLPALVSAIANCDERDRTTIDNIARTVREAGLIPTTKRGSGASEMTPREAAMLLIATNAAENAKAAPLAVAQYSQLVRWYHHFEGENEGKEEGGIFAEITAAPTFLGALEILIGGALVIAKSLTQYIEDTVDGKLPPDAVQMLKDLVFQGDYAGVEVIFNRPTQSAAIRIASTPGGRRRVHYEWRYIQDTKLMKEGVYSGTVVGDRQIQVTVGFPMILSLFIALCLGDEHERKRLESPGNNEGAPDE